MACDATQAVVCLRNVQHRKAEEPLPEPAFVPNPLRDELPAPSNMATLAPGSYFGTGTSNTSSDDDFDYDLTADEEDAFAHLIASAPSQDPQPPPATSISSREADASSSLEAGINTAFSARASVESLAYQGVNLNVANHDGGSSFEGQPGTLSVVAKGDRVLEPSIVSRDILSTSSSRGPEPRSAPGPSTGGNIRYPDCKHAQITVSPSFWHGSD